jgi:tRNA dimethylallyltransferase
MSANNTPHNTVVVLGPTASGKTRLGVHLARHVCGEVISADSRQVYRGLNIGSGKDLGEYVLDGVPIPYHLIDLVDLDAEFSVFDYQKAFYRVFEELQARGVTPVVVGGTGLYLEAILKGYRMVEVPESPALRGELAQLDTAQLVQRLQSSRPAQHNTTDLRDRDRLVRAIEIAEHVPATPLPPAPDIRPLILGTRWPREELHQRIEQRLRERLDAGMIEEVEGLLAQGVPLAKLHFLGLEYRHVADYLNGAIRNRNDLQQKLAAAIRAFAKRQETWFRRMERHGAEIHWIDRADVAQALALLNK